MDKDIHSDSMGEAGGYYVEQNKQDQHNHHSGDNHLRERGN